MRIFFYFLMISNLSLFWNLGEEEARPVCRHPSACPTGPCRRGGRAWRPSIAPEGGGKGGGGLWGEKEGWWWWEGDEGEKEGWGGYAAWWWRRARLSNSPWSLLPLVSFPCSFCFKVLSNKKKLNNHIRDIHKDPTSWTMWHQITCHSPPCPVCQNSAATVARNLLCWFTIISRPGRSQGLLYKQPCH